ncbi:MAG: hypothetical protein CML66_28395 [Rhodobacteraceae bacterium]|nr:hypothetical protein [Paracoccaceae bacterium]
MNLLKHVVVTATEDWELIRENPMGRVKRPAPGRRRTRRVYPDEIEKISAQLDLDAETWTTERQIVGAAFLFAIEAAMRSGEILAIRNRDVAGMTVHVPASKNDHPRDVPMTHWAVEILEKIRREQIAPERHPFAIDAASRDSLFRLAVKRAGVADLHFHDTRHEAITRLAKRLEILDLARVTGHKNLNELLATVSFRGVWAPIPAVFCTAHWR